LDVTSTLSNQETDRTSILLSTRVSDFISQEKLAAVSLLGPWSYGLLKRTGCVEDGPFKNRNVTMGPGNLYSSWISASKKLQSDVS
jgi:hypothetical protein